MNAVLLSLALWLPVAGLPTLDNAKPSGDVMPVEKVASGEFDVKVTPAGDTDAPIGTMTLTKTFHGGMDGPSTGIMLGVQTETQGSAGYVAMERFTGTLDGKAGSFVLQHSGSMARGQMSLSIGIVPDSGKGALSGISGTMEIRIEGGKHFYTLHYRLAD